MNPEWLINWHNSGSGSEIVELLSKYYKRPIKNDIHIWEKLNLATREIEKTNDYKDLDVREATLLFWWGRLAPAAMVTIEKIKRDNGLSKFINHMERKKKSKKAKVKRCKCK